MTTKGWTMSAVALAVAAGVYFALETLYPPQHDTAAALPMLAAEEVFSGTLDEEAGARTMADEQASEQPAADESAAREVTDDTRAEIPEAIPAEITSAEIALEEAALEESGIEEVGIEETISAPPAEAAESTNAPGAPAEEASATVADSDVAPAPAPVDTPAAKPSPVPAVKSAARTPTLSEWWHTGALADAPDALELQYAGSVAGRPAIALLFSGEFDTSESADRNALVFDMQGRRIAGQWSISSKANMLEFSVPEAGYYTVMVSGALQDATGATLGRTLKGPVRVK